MMDPWLIQVARDRTATPSRGTLAIILLAAADDAGRIGMSLAEIGARAGLSRPGTLAALKGLEAAGHITFLHAVGNRTNHRISIRRRDAHVEAELEA